jgi:hypothetical protein
MSEPFNVEAFAKGRDNVLIAPAGFGKTHAISECLQYTVGKQLVLTHTQAGVASIRDKLQKRSISEEKYSVETISSFAKRYVLSFSNLPSVPDETSDEFYPFFIENAIKILKFKLVQDIVKLSYAGLFVDEYQDCTVDQHNLILLLSEILPTHILGDPLQGIFDFKGQKLIDLNDAMEMGKFCVKYKLEIPHRWIKGGNRELGNDLLKIRKNLESGLEVDLLNYRSIEFKQGSYRDNYYYLLDVLIKNESVLVIDSDSIIRQKREKFVASFKYIPFLVESLDDKDFYKLATYFDNKEVSPSIDILDGFLCKNFSNLDNWYNKTNKKFKKKKNYLEESKLLEVKELVLKLEKEYSLLDMKKLIFKIKDLKGVNCARRDLLKSIGKSMEDAYYSKIAVLDAMRNHRNVIRMVGRKIYGKCVGTTLLTKGLEFDTVIVLDADKFIDPKNLYVALSRCVKRLIVLAANSKLNPHVSV